MLFLRCRSRFHISFVASPIYSFFVSVGLAPISFFACNYQGKINLLVGNFFSFVYPIIPSSLREGDTHQTLLFFLFYLGVTKFNTLRRRVKLFLWLFGVRSVSYHNCLLFSSHLLQKLGLKITLKITPKVLCLGGL